MSEGRGDMGERRDPQAEPEKPSTPVPTEGKSEKRLPQTQSSKPQVPIPSHYRLPYLKRLELLQVRDPYIGIPRRCTNKVCHDGL